MTDAANDGIVGWVVTWKDFTNKPSITQTVFYPKNENHLSTKEAALQWWKDEFDWEKTVFIGMFDADESVAENWENAVNYHHNEWKKKNNA